MAGQSTGAAGKTADFLAGINPRPVERNHVHRWYSRHRNRWVSTELKLSVRGWLGQKGYENGRLPPLRASSTAVSLAFE
jgi:hypothetical protein